MNWHLSVILLSEIIVYTVFFQSTLGYELFDGEHPHGLHPVLRNENKGYLSLLEDPSSSGVLSYVRPGRRMLKLPQTLIPYPRTGRVTDEDYDFTYIPDYSWSTSQETDLFDSVPKFTARLGRKKRSLSDDDSEHNGKKESQNRHELAKAILDEFEEFEPDYYYRQSRRPSSRSRNSFVPRVGKRVSNEDYEETEDKRAAAFTPRIGRAALIPRIGRNDPRFKVKSRGAFIPRIGRRASLMPRIGKSQEHHGESEIN
uniref:Uncharacterized protein n=1 Tax=Parasteatoda tepidariorum TaxID=114398 RepID=A0A2L2YHM3_PARTP